MKTLELAPRKRTMVKSKLEKKSNPKRRVAVGCQGGGAHAAFGVGVLAEILRAYEAERFDLVGLSGTSAGALCTFMTWYGLVPKKHGSRGSGQEAIDTLKAFGTISPPANQLRLC